MENVVHFFQKKLRTAPICSPFFSPLPSPIPTPQVSPTTPNAETADQVSNIPPSVEGTQGSRVAPMNPKRLDYNHEMTTSEEEELDEMIAVYEKV